MPDGPPPPAVALPRAGARPEPVTAEQPLCASGDLAERGLGVLFDVRLWGQPARAFALRFDGRVVAYINRCAHVPVEMDWQPGHFLDGDGRTILCSIHGAAYDPADGRCVGGPGGRGRLMPVAAAERDGRVYWYPSRDIQPAPPAAPASPESSP